MGERAVLVPYFDLWEEGYAGHTVRVLSGSGPALADLYYDEAKTLRAPNPQVLDSLITDDGCRFGRFVQPVYTDADTISLQIQGMGAGGIWRTPVLSLVGADVSEAVVRPSDAGEHSTLASLLSLELHVGSFGTLTSNRTDENTNLIQSVINIASGRGGGRVRLPAGAFSIRRLDLPARVTLIGAGKDVTTLRSQFAGEVLTGQLGLFGIEDLTLDGQTVVPGSVGLSADNVDSVRIKRVRVTRFNIGVRLRGSRQVKVEDTDCDACNRGVEIIATPLVGDVHGLQWINGVIKANVLYGLYLQQTGGPECGYNHFGGLWLRDNLGEAIKLFGVRNTRFTDLAFQGNAENIDMLDTAFGDVSNIPCLNISFTNCRFIGGKHVMRHTAQDIRFEACRFHSVTWTLAQLLNSILLSECIETGSTTIEGDVTKLQRPRRTLEGTTTVVTTNAANTPLWKAKLAPGQTITGVARIGVSSLSSEKQVGFIVHFVAKRPGAKLNYDQQTANFTVGATITGATSGASGRLVAMNDTGSAGTLTLRQIIGQFQDNETLTGSSGGAAKVNGQLIYQDCEIGVFQVFGALQGTSTAPLVEMKVQSDEVHVRGIGVSNVTLEWACDVQAVLTT